ncbi:MAG: hypothetical protein QM536_03320 [Chitinophagaceae bacterium]|nr:hypothetical protein [Chitinophagaceae bacterium]
MKLSEFIKNYWDVYALVLGITFIVLSFILLLYFLIYKATLKEPKEHYDYINKSEKKNLWRISLLATLSITFFLNYFFVREDIGDNVLKFLAVAFSFLIVGLILAVIFRYYFNVYYPLQMEKRLEYIRHKIPRFLTDENGRRIGPLRLLNEEEEDLYLDEGMQREELLNSIDYDVWIDDTTGLKKIERYDGKLHALKCSECGYQTLRIDKSEMIHEATEFLEGEMVKYYHCDYCEHKEKRHFIIHKISIK